MLGLDGLSGYLADVGVKRRIRTAVPAQSATFRIAAYDDLAGA